MAKYTEMFTQQGERRLVGEKDVEKYLSFGWTFEKKSAKRKANKVVELDILDIREKKSKKAKSSSSAKSKKK